MKFNLPKKGNARLGSISVLQYLPCKLLKKTSTTSKGEGFAGVYSELGDTYSALRDLESKLKRMSPGLFSFESKNAMI